MSSCNRRFMLLMPLALAACGFEPVYGTGGSGGPLQGQVEVSAPETRDAFLVTQRIEERLGRTTNASYELVLKVESIKQGLAVNPEGNITRFNILGVATYELINAGTGDVAQSGQAESFTGYSATGSTVTTLAAERDAQERLMIILADQIVAELLAASAT